MTHDEALPGQYVPYVEDDPLWYKDAVIYQLHVRAFYDSNNDGVGDFQGLIEKLPYIQELGVNTLWVLPFYPSPLKDDGYDISDYFGVHPDYGTVRDVRRFIREAHARGLRIITELVVNHTSEQHAWFQAARRAPKGSSKRAFYVWSDTCKRYEGTRVIFRDTETSNWTWDNVAQQYYWHRFFSHQPDLNYDNPRVLDAVLRVMRFWLDMGVDGLRLDAIPYLCEREGTSNENLPESHEVLRKIRRALDSRYRNRMLLAEANQWPEDVRPYFGDGDECHMAFHFPLMPRIFMAVAQEDRHPIVEILGQTPDIPDNCQWAVFLRNHDELTLEMVTDRERDYLYQVYARDPRMRINLGIRRRLAPLVDNDIDRIRLLNNLLLSLPGSPIIYYGDDIGMGDNIYVGDRNGVRTPMQWSPDRNAGFSRADPARLYLPPVMDAVYGYQAVNVEAQSGDPFSLLNWMRHLISIRKAHRAFGRGRIDLLSPGNRKVFAFIRQYEQEIILCVTNLSRAAQPVELDLVEYKGLVPVELLGHTAFPPIGEMPYLLTLPGHGFYWFELSREASVPSWHEEYPSVLDLPVLVLFSGWSTLFPETLVGADPAQRRLAGQVRSRMLDDLWPRFLAQQRWFMKQEGALRIAMHQEWEVDGNSALLAIIEAGDTRYFAPLVIVWEEDSEDRIRLLGHHPLARVRRGPKPGLLLDAYADSGFCSALIRAMGENRRVPFAGGELHFHSTARFGELAGFLSGPVAARLLGVEQTHTSVVVGERLLLKGYRRLAPGISPELEMTAFLTDVSPFAHIAPLAGYFEQISPSGETIVLGSLQAFVPNQGDGWSQILGYLQRHLDHERTDRAAPGTLQDDANRALYAMLLRQLGIRTGELHRALAVTAGVDAFEPETASREECLGWFDETTAAAVTMLGRIEAERDRLDAELVPLADRVLALRERILARLGSLRDCAPDRALKTRYHGDYHLGQVLVVDNDLVIVDFEGEPMRPVAERRRKHSPLRDVAGMLRSFSYASLTALRLVTSNRAQDLTVLEQSAAAWERDATRLFLDGYAEATGASPLQGPSGALTDPLLELWLWDKVFYEVGYELANRPTWVALPLLGMIALLEQPLPETGSG
ncbi:MAG: maltose alpha-D-glucosyltransferase [Acidiferrobacteraceae bacterium]